MGFDDVNPSLLYRINLFMNCIDLTWMYSLSKGKFSIPKFWNAKKASITGKELIKSKQHLITLYEKIKTKTAE